MKFSDKYTNATDNIKDRIVLTDDAYAIAETVDNLIINISNLIKKMEHLRMSL